MPPANHILGINWFLDPRSSTKEIMAIVMPDYPGTQCIRRYGNWWDPFKRSQIIMKIANQILHQPCNQLCNQKDSRLQFHAYILSQRVESMRILSIHPSILGFLHAEGRLMPESKNARRQLPWRWQIPAPERCSNNWNEEHGYESNGIDQTSEKLSPPSL